NLTPEDLKENYYSNENSSLLEDIGERDQWRNSKNRISGTEKTDEVTKFNDRNAAVSSTSVYDRGKGVTFHLGNLTPEYSSEQFEKKRQCRGLVNPRILEFPSKGGDTRNLTHEKAFFFLNTTATESSTSSESHIAGDTVDIKQRQEILDDKSKRESLDSFPFSKLLSPSFSSPIARRYSASADPPSVLSTTFPGLTVSHNAMQIRAPAARIMLQKTKVPNKN
uniref:Uncharacterized protein n=1 Tax=Romanomermis culicivorax TaxID=13658 RepID=A0A915I574_ROMCU